MVTFDFKEEQEKAANFSVCVCVPCDLYPTKITFSSAPRGGVLTAQDYKRKTDKASVLRAAIDYVKQLKEKVDELEKQGRKSAAETVILVNKTDSINGNEYSSSILPEMEARVLGKEVLIEIHCEKEYGVELKILDHLENLHLCVTGSSVLPFGNSALCITITAQMDEEYEMTVNDLVKNLREVLSKSHLVTDSDPY